MAPVSIVAAFVTATLINIPSLAGQAQPSATCKPTGELVRLFGISEASGLAVSRRVPGRLWAHNDSGQPMLFALDERGSVTGQLRIAGANAEDWEAVASARCGTGSCLYIGDIGDNNTKRDHVTVYRVPEPDASATTSAPAEAFHATYPDGPHDAETLLIAPDGRLHIVTKGSSGAIALYRFPADLRAGSTTKLERVGNAAGDSTDRDSRITDGAISPDGRWAALRSPNTLMFFRTSDLLAGRWHDAFRVDLKPLKEPQGEGVAIGANDTIFVAGESGGEGKGGTFARFSCVPRE
jgi:hypothetical protein